MKIHNNKKNRQNIVKFRDYKSRFEVNMGIVIFGIVFIYIMATIVIYLITPHISVYEIQEGTLIEDSQYTGIIIRDEEIVSSTSAGYIQYYYTEGSHVTTTSGIYSLSSSNNTTIVASSGTITDEALDEIEGKILSFNSKYSNLNFSNVYDLKDEINSIILDSYTNSIGEFSTVNGIEVIHSPGKGNISYIIDGYESVTVDNFSMGDLDENNYSKTVLTSGTQISAYTPVYKLVTSEEWSLIIDISDDDAEKLTELTKVEVNILEDDVNVTAAITLIEKDGETYAKLDFDSGMIRYISNRFLDIELVFSSINGLKIPISSVSTEEFFEIPVEYATYGGNSSSRGILLEQEDGTYVFTSLSIYYSTDEYYYALANNLGTTSITMANPDTSETLTLRSTVPLEGIYSVNKGYAIFECIEILASSEEYYIITNSTDWTVKNYDYIVLDGSLVEINDIVF